INTVPKETLVKITKAEDGGIGGKGTWEAATRGYGPGSQTPQNQQYLAGGDVKKKTKPQPKRRAEEEAIWRQKPNVGSRRRIQPPGPRNRRIPIPSTRRPRRAIRR